MGELVDINVDGAQDLSAVPAGEYVVRVLTAKISISERGNKGMTLMFKVIGEDFSMPVSHYIMFPGEGMTNDEINKRKLAMRDFYNAFKLAPPFDIEELKNLEASAYLTIVSEENPEYADKNGNRNRISRFISSR